ncbi:tRNA pseudouridine(38-40) synthase TruA [Myxococcota bacterium]|nr:tRNA pseudouridine(38-40) synthase TruA [Myxococcota bacterium]MBU1382323.1 tRNA pseudouridine(38-40) synthase TruA [Myxococcota bacterium]MBU1498445.1 tRNA pseudouridine(38-40) synthase TruA [Myxococcota bacterium]
MEREVLYGVLLEVAYDGTAYCGFQYQENGPTVQAALEKAISTLEKRFIRVKGASRTDSGVHARGQRLFFTTPNNIPETGYMKGLNTVLPRDISAVSVRKVPVDFNPRLTAGKVYIYRINLHPVRDPFEIRWHWHYFHSLDMGRMIEAATYIKGTHDFDCFQAADCERDNTTRTIYSINVDRCGYTIEIKISGSAFLKNMVRIISGTLVDVGRGFRNPEYVKQLIESKDRTQAGMTAPACGLTLEKIIYPDEDTSVLFF